MIMYRSLVVCTRDNLTFNESSRDDFRVNERSQTTTDKVQVSTETSTVLRRWESETRKFGFMKRLDKGRITIVKDLESWRFERLPFVRASRGIVGVVGFCVGFAYTELQQRYLYLSVYENGQVIFKSLQRLGYLHVAKKWLPSCCLSVHLWPQVAQALYGEF